MKTLLKRVRARIVKPEQKLDEIMPGLKRLAGTITDCSISADPMSALIRFFNATSEWHDRGLRDVITALEEVNWGQHTQVLEDLRELEAHLINAGRNEYGMNRTQTGETVTADSVFLGNVKGLFTKPVSFWRRVIDPDIRRTIEWQAQTFMFQHTEMCKIIERLSATS